MENEEDSQNRSQELRSAHDGYIRRSDLLKTLGAVVGVLGTLFGAYGIIDRITESIRLEIRNERTERINADNQLQLRQYECCARRR